MDDDERSDMLDHFDAQLEELTDENDRLKKQLAELIAENARLRRRLDEVTRAYESSVGALRLLARGRGVATDPSTRGRAIASDFSSATASVSVCLPGR